jgi:hypothetical protein
MSKPIGRPPKLTPEVIETICAAIREGCYATVAGARAGVGKYTMYLWNQRGQREAEQREERRILGDAVEEPPPSIYEQFHVALEQAKAEARYSAETRVFNAMPLWWLKNGYPRNDWRESHQRVREAVDELMRRVHAEQYMAWLAAGDLLPAEPTPEQQWQHTYYTQHADPDFWDDQRGMKKHVQTCPICRANAAHGTADWDRVKWDHVLGPLVPDRMEDTPRGDAD